MKKLWQLATATTLLFAGVLRAAPADRPPFVRITPGAVHWRAVADSPGVEVATLVGDPEKTGFYVVRVRFPPHVMDRPHWHPNARYVTVLSGTWYAGTGEHFDPAKATPLPAGSFMVHPAGATHWDGSAGDAPVVVQIVGYGPETSTPLDASQPFWVVVPSAP